MWTHPIIEIGDDDFGIWYLDCQEDPQKYVGQDRPFPGRRVCQTSRAGKNSFVPGPLAMTCCVQDIQFVGFPCVYDGYKAPGAAQLGDGHCTGGLQVPQHLPG